MSRHFRHLPHGFAFPLIIVATLLLAIIAYFVMANQKRQSDVLRIKTENIKFSEINNRLRNIMSAPGLCTCNLKDLPLAPNAAVTLNSTVRIEEGIAPLRDVLGYYKLKNTGDRGCEDVPPIIDYNNDVVLNFRQNTNYPKSIHAKYASISQFQLFQSISDQVKRYKASLTFVAKDDFSVSKSNSDSPVDLEVYVEVDSSSGQYLIRQCFLPVLVAIPPPVPPPPPPAPAPAPSPMPPPSPPPSSSPSPAPPPSAPAPVPPPPAPAPPPPPSCTWTNVGTTNCIDDPGACEWQNSCVFKGWSGSGNPCVCGAGSCFTGSSGTRTEHNCQ